MLKSLIMFLIIALGLSAQKTVTMNSTPTDPDRVKLKKVKVLMDEDEGFYEEVYSTISPNGKVFILDYGNKVIHRYSLTGSLEKSFGKEGNGPGELNQFSFGLLAGKDRLYVWKGQTIMIFDHDGALKSEITGYPQIFFGSPSMDGDKLTLTFPQWGKAAKYKQLVFSKDGKLIDKNENVNFEQPQQQGFNDERLKEQINRPRSIHPFGDKYIQLYNHAYKMEVLSSSLKKRIRAHTFI